jgi:predicted dehydrogenase
LGASAGFLSAAAVSSLPLNRAAHAAGSDVFKVGLIGCGGRGSGAAVNAMNADPSVRLVAMTDIFADRLESSLKTLKTQKADQVLVDKDHAFVGFDGCRKVIESGIDLVLIACASRFHPEYMKAAIDGGKHVFVEKPHAIDPAGIRLAEAAVEEARKKGLSVASGLLYRYDPGMRETIQRIHDGAIGEITAIEENYLRSPYRLVARPPGMSEIEYQFYNWYHFTWLSGDDIPQSLIHNLDKSQWAVREEPPVKAHGVGGRSASFGEVYGNCFDHYAAVYQYANGLRLYAHGRTQVGCHQEVSDIFLGTKGRCELMKKRIEGETNWEYAGPKAAANDLEHKELFDAIRQGKRIDDGLHMLRSTQVGLMGQLAVYTGREITWEQMTASTFKYPPTAGPCDFSIDPPVNPLPDGTYPIPVPGVTKML